MIESYCGALTLLSLLKIFVALNCSDSGTVLFTVARLGYSLNNHFRRSYLPCAVESSLDGYTVSLVLVARLRILYTMSSNGADRKVNLPECRISDIPPSLNPRYHLALHIRTAYHLETLYMLQHLTTRGQKTTRIMSAWKVGAEGAP